MFKYYSYLGAKNQSETGVMFTNRAIENGAPHCMCHGQVTWDAWLMNILQDGTQTMLVLTMYRLNRDQAMIGDETDIYIYILLFLALIAARRCGLAVSCGRCGRQPA